MIKENLKKRTITSVILIFLLYFTLKFNNILIITLTLIGVLSILEFFNLSKKIFKNNILLLCFNILISLYVFIFCCLFIYISNIIQLKLLLFLLLFGCIASDIGGYVFGNLFKGPKLTKISPNKTYFGAVGSLIFTILIFYCFFYLSNYYLSAKIIILAIITSLACQIGDLFVSLLKRKANSKDTGNLLPGHGGVLDRLDGIFLGIPIGFIVIILIY